MALLAALWLGVLLCVAGIATPAPFALLDKADAGRVVARILSQEAALSVVMGAVMLILQRARSRHLAVASAARQFDASLALAAAAVFCTVAGYYAIQPLMVDARAGHGPLSFGQLHAISAAFYGLKVLLVAVLAVRLSLGLSRSRASSD